MESPDLKIIPFKTSKVFGSWLKRHHASSPGIWMQIYKKGSGVSTVTYSEALEEALCWGWIDSQKKSLDPASYLQRFGPRRNKSIWSKINRLHIARLTKAGRMQDAGTVQVTNAKADGRWDSAYDSPKNMVIPADLLNALSKNKKAAKFFKTLNKSNTYAMVWRLQTAKKLETRIRRMTTIIAMLEKGDTFH